MTGRAAQSTALPSLRLLIVEDVTDDAELLLAALARAYSVSHQRVDTVAALRAALAAAEWDLLITDYSLPSMTALDVLRELSATDIDLPCLVYSGSIEEESAVEVLRGGARDFISKNRQARLLPAVTRELREADQRREKRRATEALRHAQRLESIGRLTGGIAHDFNNLLTAILGFSSLLLEDPFLTGAPAHFKRDLEEVRKAGERAALLTGQLLAFSRKQVVQTTVVNINAIVTDLMPMLRRLIPSDIQIGTELADDLSAIVADGVQLEQVIMNLVVNARDAMPRGGLITIATANVALEDARVQHAGFAGGPYVQLALSDSGTGMTPEVQAKLFEPFFTTKPPGRGTGLGLSTVFGVVKQHRGVIEVDTAIGRGTSFLLYFPRAHQPLAAPNDTATSPAPTAGHTILLVEDDNAVRSVARQMLTRAGYRVIEAANAPDATRLALAHHGSIALLITDVVMPGGTGPALSLRLRERFADLKVLFISGYPDQAVVQEAAGQNGVVFLQKPFTSESFARAVKEALDG